jgi:phospholipase/carboxylesterase
LLHGWGANYHDLAALAPYLGLSDYLLVLPNAPFPHPQVPGGRMWYDLSGDYSFQSSFDLTQNAELATSRQRLTDWLGSLESTTGIPLAQTVLAGFSQGGAMTLDVGLTLPLKALMVLSGYLHAPISQPLISQQTAAPPPILMIHGIQDTVVPISAARAAKTAVEAIGGRVTYHELNMGHEIQPDALKIMQSFLLEPGVIT